MTVWLRGAHARSVPKETRRLILEFEPGSNPIAGRLGDGQEAQPFSGWLEFAAALRSALESVPEGSTLEPRRTDGS
jgi:hypothetical protein